VFARAIVSRWSRASVAAVGAPSMDPSPAGEAVVPGDRRTPVRIDVTPALQAWQAAGTPFEGLALAADGDGVVVDGVGAANPADRPRLEVVLR
jgi:hypothetical protein